MYGNIPTFFGKFFHQNFFQRTKRMRPRWRSIINHRTNFYCICIASFQLPSTSCFRTFPLSPKDMFFDENINLLLSQLTQSLLLSHVFFNLSSSWVSVVRSINTLPVSGIGVKLCSTFANKSSLLMYFAPTP